MKKNNTYQDNRIIEYENTDFHLRVNPDLADEIGLKESMLLMQIEYFITISNNIRDGRKWTYQSYKDFQEKGFKFTSKKTIERKVKKLKKEGYIFMDNYNKHGYDRTYWYSLNYEKLKELDSITINEDNVYNPYDTKNCQSDKCNGTKRQIQSDKLTNGSRQNDITIPNTTQNNTANNKTNNLLKSSKNQQLSEDKSAINEDTETNNENENISDNYKDDNSDNNKNNSTDNETINNKNKADSDDVIADFRYFKQRYLETFFEEWEGEEIELKATDRKRIDIFIDKIKENNITSADEIIKILKHLDNSVAENGLKAIYNSYDYNSKKENSADSKDTDKKDDDTSANSEDTSNKSDNTSLIANIKMNKKATRDSYIKLYQYIFNRKPNLSYIGGLKENTIKDIKNKYLKEIFEEYKKVNDTKDEYEKYSDLDIYNEIKNRFISAINQGVYKKAKDKFIK